MATIFGPLGKCKTLEQLDELMKDPDAQKTEIGESRGRKVTLEGKEYSLNQIYEKCLSLCKNGPFLRDNARYAISIGQRIAKLNKQTAYKKGLGWKEKIVLGFKKFFGDLPFIFKYGFSYRSESNIKKRLLIVFTNNYTKQILKEVGKIKRNVTRPKNVCTSNERIGKLIQDYNAIKNILTPPNALGIR